MCEAPHIYFLQNLHWKTTKLLCTTYAKIPLQRDARVQSASSRLAAVCIDGFTLLLVWGSCEYRDIQEIASLHKDARMCLHVDHQSVALNSMFLMHSFFLLSFLVIGCWRGLLEGGRNIGLSNRTKNAMGMDCVPKRSRTSTPPRLNPCEV